MDFGKFLKDNGIKKVEIASYLGVSSAFITQLCSGIRKLPNDKLALILSNDHWDVSALTKADNIAIAMEYSTANAGGNVNGGSAEIAVLKKEIEMLQKMLDEKDATIEFLKSLINK